LENVRSSCYRLQNGRKANSLPNLPAGLKGMS
jgi:hypothetical protein